jgi:ligand-binding sensor domain-containing protein
MIRFRELIIIFLFCSLQLQGLGNKLSFSRLSVENGLSNNLVNAIYKDSFGFIWFGTLEGLDRYDGVEIRPSSSKFPQAVENCVCYYRGLPEMPLGGNFDWIVQV